MKKEILVLSYCLIHLAILSVVRSSLWRKWRLRAQVAGDEGYSVLRYSDFRRNAGWFLSALLLALLLASYLCPWDFYEQLPWVEFTAGSALLLAGSLAAWYPVIESQGRLILVRDEGVRAISPWSRSISFKWNEVTSLRWIPILPENFVIRTTRGIMFVSPVLLNLDIFAKQVMRNVPRERWMSSEKMLRKAERGPFEPYR